MDLVTLGTLQFPLRRSSSRLASSASLARAICVSP